MSDAKVNLKVADGWAILPSSLKRADGSPRFSIRFPTYLAQDLGAQALVGGESADGYEPPTRNLLERFLRSGDLFIDVGAHWGFFSFQAASHAAGNISAVAFEPDPTNSAILLRNVNGNALSDRVHLVCAACGDKNEIAPLICNTSMGHSLRGVGLKPPYGRGATMWVPVTTLDTALAALPQLPTGRIILKIDAEGYEPMILAGARSLLDTGRVALIIWECGEAYSDGFARQAMQQMVNSLTARGFAHLRPPEQHVDGPLVPFTAETRYVGNVFSAAAGVQL